MTHADEQDGRSETYDYDPFEYVPERISPLTASGLAWLDEQLTADNRTTLHSLPIERQAGVLARLVESGAIRIRPAVVSDVLDSLDDDSDRGDLDQDQEGD